jgi:hypothetical protein
MRSMLWHASALDRDQGPLVLAEEGEQELQGLVLGLVLSDSVVYIPLQHRRTPIFGVAWVVIHLHFSFQRMNVILSYLRLCGALGALGFLLFEASGIPPGLLVLKIRYKHSHASSLRGKVGLRLD